MGWSKSGWNDDNHGWYTPKAIGPTPVPTYLSDQSLTDNGGTQKLGTGIAIGAASSNRQVFMALMTYATDVPSSVTFTPTGGGAIPATQATPNPPGSGTGCFIFQATVPTATTMDVAVNFSSNPFANYYVAFWSIDGNTMNSTTPTSANSNGAAAGSNSIGTTISTQAGGFTLVCSFQNAFSGNSGSIGGTDAYTQRVGLSADGGWNLAADASGLSTNVSDAVTATFALNTAILGVAATHWR